MGIFSTLVALSEILSTVSTSKSQQYKIKYSLYTKAKKSVAIHKISESIKQTTL